MENCQTQRRNQDHYTIQHDEIRLILHDGVCPAACHLHSTVATPREDGKGGKHEPCSEELELGSRWKDLRLW